MNETRHTSGGSPTRRKVLGYAGGAALVGCRAPAETSSARHAEEEAALDERFSHLADARGDHAPITSEEKSARVTRLGTELARAGLDALLVEPGATLRYLTDVAWGTSERLFALA